MRVALIHAHGVKVHEASDLWVVPAGAEIDKAGGVVLRFADNQIEWAASPFGAYLHTRSRILTE
jgi:hypothetical protein